MLLNASQLNEITDTLFIQFYKKIKQLVYTSNARYELKDLLSELGMEHLFPTMTVPAPEKRILLLGASQVNEDDLKEAAQTLGFSPGQIDFCCDYARLSNFDISRIQDSNKYSHLLIGPIPHSMKGTRKIQNLISYIEQNASRFPAIIRICDSTDHLSISRSSFLQALSKVRESKCPEKGEKLVSF